MAQWVKSLTAVAWVTAEAWVQAPAGRSWLKGSSVVTAAFWTQSLAQELPYATGAAIKKNKQKNV